MNYAKALSAGLITLILVALTACGGGGSASPSGANTVSGVAATGAPILGTVTLKDKNGLQRGPVTTDTNGNFSVDVTDLKPPFILKIVESTGNPPTTLFSVATAAGTANINPLTHLALQLAANSDPATVFGAQGSTPDTSQINGANISAAQDRIKALLAPLLAKYGITDFDPINGTYSATPDNKLDTMLDVIAVKLNNGTLSITNKLAGTTIASGNIANIAAMTLAMANTPDSTRLTDIKEITQMLAALKAVMNLGAALTAGPAENLFIPDPNYGTSSGHTRAQDMAGIVTVFGAGGTNKNGPLKSLQNLRLLSDQSANYAGRGVAKAYLLNYDFIYENGAIVHGNTVILAKEASSGLWKFIGDPVQNSGLGSNIGGNTITAYTGNTIIAYPGNNAVNVIAGTNIITATTGSNTGTGYTGNTVIANTGNNAITAITGNNTITANTSNTVVSAAGGNTVTATTGSNTITAQIPANWNNIVAVTATNGGNTVTATTGSNTITANTVLANTCFNCLTGNNRGLVISTNAGTTVTVGSGSNTIAAYPMSAAGGNSVIGANLANAITATVGSNTITARTGN